MLGTVLDSAAERDRHGPDHQPILVALLPRRLPALRTRLDGHCAVGGWAPPPPHIVRAELGPPVGLPAHQVSPALRSQLSHKHAHTYIHMNTHMHSHSPYTHSHMSRHTHSTPIETHYTQGHTIKEAHIHPCILIRTRAHAHAHTHTHTHAHASSCRQWRHGRVVAGAVPEAGGPGPALRVRAQQQVGALRLRCDGAERAVQLWPQRSAPLFDLVSVCLPSSVSLSVPLSVVSLSVVPMHGTCRVCSAAAHP